MQLTSLPAAVCCSDTSCIYYTCNLHAKLWQKSGPEQVLLRHIINIAPGWAIQMHTSALHPRSCSSTACMQAKIKKVSEHTQAFCLWSIMSISATLFDNTAFAALNFATWQAHEVCSVAACMQAEVVQLDSQLSCHLGPAHVNKAMKFCFAVNCQSVRMLSCALYAGRSVAASEPKWSHQFPRFSSPCLVVTD